MNPAGKALWFVESHFGDAITLDDIADAAGVSRFHVTRAFAEATGLSAVRYLRARRLAEAARALAGGATDILAVALEAGYGSHEAFTRAFREQFGLTPEAVRERGSVEGLEIMEPKRMNQKMNESLEKPREAEGQALLIAGLGERYNVASNAGIPSQWQRFVPQMGSARVTYGVCCNQDDEGNFDYICGIEVADFSKLPADWSRVRLSPQKYLVFTHKGHITGIQSTFNAIWNKALPESGFKAADAPLFERYDERFNGMTGFGDVEIWVPVK
jgi:AraC family transcriptional regulator